LFTFKDVTVYQKSFISYLNKIKNPSIDKAFVNFKEQEVLNYYKTYIERDNLEFAKTFKEFKEGLLLFDLLEKRVWEKSKDTTLLQAYYNENKLVKYQNKAFETVKGTVISDFQELLEKQWIESLHKKYKVDFNKSEKNKVLKLKI
jgi:peptidyl-prolyl cis-trans isomerase SurA